MQITLHKAVIGTDSHLIWDGSLFLWESTVPRESWVFGDSQHPMSLDLACEVKDKKVMFPCAIQRRIWEQIPMSHDLGVKWHLSMRRDSFKDVILDVLEQLWMLLNDKDGSYYLNELYRVRKLLFGLSTAKVDLNAIKQFAREDNVMSSALESFIPVHKSDYARIPRYCQTKTVTGRLTITDGPNILTLKKNYRKILKSRYVDGSIVQVDFVSLEPRVLLSFLEKDCPRDIYKHISQHVFEGKIDRQKAKILTLGVVYGLSSKSLAERMEIPQANALRLSKKIKNYFCLAAFTKALTRSANSGKIKNIYGRDIDVSHDPSYVIVNRFVQSSAADAALLAFFDMINKLKTRTDEIKHIFVIHDAIIFDVSEEGYKILREELRDGVAVPKFQSNFPVDIEVITHNKL